jgi:hypothetical protein
MDAIGARELRKRLEEQEQWRLADAVRDGRQSGTDPDACELEETADGVRYYGREEERTIVDGRQAIVTFRLVKKIAGGRWETSCERETVRYLGEATPADPAR